MRTVCPSCGAVHSFDGLVESTAGRDALRLLAPLPPDVAIAFVAYLGMYRHKKHGLTWRKVLIVAEELVPMILEETVQYRERTLPASSETWAAGLNRVVDRRHQMTLPITNSGYLLKTVLELAERAEDERETRKEEALRRGSHRRGEEPAKGAGQVAADVMAEISEIRGDESMQLISTELASELAVGLRAGRLTPDQSAARRIEARQEADNA